MIFVFVHPTEILAALEGLEDVRVPAYERRGPDIELMVEQVLGVAECGSASIFPTQRSMIRCVGHTVVLDRCFLPASDLPPFVAITHVTRPRTARWGYL